MRALPYGAARFLLYRSGRAARVSRYALPIGPAGPGYAPRAVRFGTQQRNLSPISNATADISESCRSAAASTRATIYALSTGAGRAAIAVVRVSGPACIEIYRALCPNCPLPKPRYATLRTLYDPSCPPTKDSILDSSALVLYFPAPKSVTGEDVLELHIHGGPAIIKAVLAAISRCAPPANAHSIRYAEPGEFTRRAFMNDRLDLPQIEALGDTLSATTEQQRRLSIRGTTSGLGKRYESWRQKLLYARGELEALIDFSEDQHFDESPTQLAASVAAQVQGLREQIKAHCTNAVRGELLRNGINISLLGAPNAGKSSLLNRIVGREAAIVSKEAGTTRDVVEIGLDIGGWYCKLGDMAGLRSGSAADKISAFPHTSLGKPIVGEVEQEGIRRAKQRALESDILIIVLSIEPNPHGSLEDYHLPIDPSVQQTASIALSSHQNALVVINKTDLLLLPPSDSEPPTPTIPPSYTAAILAALPSLDPSKIFPISCKRACDTNPGDPSDPGGIQAFLGGLVREFQAMTEAVGRDDGGPLGDFREALGATERQRLLLDKCLWHLDEFVGLVSSAPGSLLSGAAAVELDEEIDIVLAAESLRAAAECLARITGRGEAGDVEEVLGVVFEK